MSSSSVAVAANYVKLTQREHCLVRPDSYVGSTSSHPEHRWIYDPATNTFSPPVDPPA